MHDALIRIANFLTTKWPALVLGLFILALLAMVAVLVLGRR